MKKKRFLKLVMSYGIQRDKAARMAARVGKFGSYEALFLSLRPSLAFWQMGAAVRKAGRTIRQDARAFGDMFAAMGTALAACFSPALRGYVDDAKEREQKQADFSAAGNVFLPSTHEIIAGTQPEEENTAARWWPIMKPIHMWSFKAEARVFQAIPLRAGTHTARRKIYLTK